MRLPFPIEIKLNSTLNNTALHGLKNFINDTGAPFEIMVNRAHRVELLSENIAQVPVNYV